MPINPGALTRRVTIEARSVGVDSHGQAVETWATVATVWAQPMPKAAREYFAAGQVQEVRSFAWRIRHRDDITAAMRVVEGSTLYDIDGVVPAGSREWLDLMCVSGVRDGR